MRVLNYILNPLICTHLEDLDRLIPKDTDAQVFLGAAPHERESLRIEGLKTAAASIVEVVVWPLYLLRQLCVCLYSHRAIEALSQGCGIILSPLGTIPWALICLVVVIPSLFAPEKVWGTVIAFSEKLQPQDTHNVKPSTGSFQPIDETPFG